MKNRSGVVGSGCGFQSDEIQKPVALGIALVLPAPPAWGRDWGWGGGWSLRGEGKRTFKANGQDTPCPTGSSWPEAVTQPDAPTLLPSGPEPQPEPAVVCFTTLNHS